MASILDSIRAALRKPKATTDQLAANLELARKAEADALSAVERQVQVVAGGYLDDDATRAAARAKLADLRAIAEDAGLVLAEVRRRHDAALAETEQGRRGVIHAAAKEKVEAAAETLRKAYPAAIRQIGAVLHALAEAELAVSTANGCLPAGAEPLPDAETLVRSTPGLPSEFLGEERIELWASIGTGLPLDGAYQGEVKPIGGGRGIRHTVQRNHAFEEVTSTHTYELRPFIRRRTAEFVPGITPPKLASHLRLPGLFGDQPLFDGQPWATAPASILDRAERLKDYSPEPPEPSTAIRRAHVELVPDPSGNRAPTPRPVVDTGRSRFATRSTRSAPARAGRR